MASLSRTQDRDRKWTNKRGHNLGRLEDGCVSGNQKRQNLNFNEPKRTLLVNFFAQTLGIF